MGQGDIALTAPLVLPSLQLLAFHIAFAPSPSLTITWADNVTGAVHTVTLTDTGGVGFDYAAGVFQDGIVRGVTNEYSKMLAALFKANAKTIGVQLLVTDGVITAAGTVG